MGHREESATGRSGSQGGVTHVEEGPTGRSGPQGIVGHREEFNFFKEVFMKFKKWCRLSILFSGTSKVDGK